MLSPIVPESKPLSAVTSPDVAVFAETVNSTTVAFPPDALGRKTVRGVVWLTLLATGIKVFQIVGLVPLAWFLSPGDFGLIGLMTTVASFAALAQQVGLKEVLIQRPRSIRRLENPAFWMSLISGLVGTATILAIALPVRLIWNPPTVFGLLCLLAIASPVQSLAILPEAILQKRMQFGLLATAGLIAAAGQVALSVFLAAMGFGAASFVIPIPLASGFRTAALWLAARPTIRPRMEMRRWRLLIGDSGLVFAAHVCAAVVGQGDYAVLGAVVAQRDLGLFFFAFTISVAPLQLFAQSLNNVLLPAFSLLHASPDRQLGACLLATRMLAVMVIPLSLLQAAVVEPIIALLFGDKWSQAVPLATILTIGMVWRSMGWPSAALLQAQGRFRTRLYLGLLWVVLLLVSVGIAGWYGGVVTAAIAEAVFYSFVGPFTIYITIRPHGLGCRQIWSIYAAPTLVGLAAIGAGWFAGQGLTEPTNALSRVLIVTTVSFLIYVPLICLTAPDITRALRRRLAFFAHV